MCVLLNFWLHWTCWFCQNWKFQQNWDFTTCMASLEFPFLWTSILIKKCLILAKFFSFKEKERKNKLKSLQFSEVRYSTKHTLYLQCPGFLAWFFRKLEWPLLYTHSSPSIAIKNLGVGKEDLSPVHRSHGWPGYGATRLGHNWRDQNRSELTHQTLHGFAAWCLKP